MFKRFNTLIIEKHIIHSGWFIIKNKKTFSSSLYELTKEVVKNLKEKVRKNEIVLVKYPYYRAKISNHKYDKGFISYATSFDEILKEKWEESSKYTFIREIKNYDVFKKTSKIITDIYNIEKDQSDYILEGFVDRIIDESIGKIDEKKQMDLISFLITDLEKTPKKWYPVIWIKGLSMESDKISLSKDIIIEKPRPEDLEFETPIYNQPTFMPNSYSQGLPDSIIKTFYREKETNIVQKKIQNLISILRLYNIGSVNYIKYELNPESILSLRGTISRFGRGTPFKYALGIDEEEKIQNFYKVIEPLVDSLNKRENKNKEKYVKIALERYNNALDEKRSESRLTYATMCLEALYLGGESELTRRLSQRVSCILGILGENPLHVSSVLKKSYKIRSRFVHGAMINHKDKKNIGTLENELFEYARKSIIISLQIHEKIKKDTFYKKIDEALLDEKKKKNLIEFIKDNCKILEI